MVALYVLFLLLLLLLLLLLRRLMLAQIILTLFLDIVDLVIVDNWVSARAIRSIEKLLELEDIVVWNKSYIICVQYFVTLVLLLVIHIKIKEIICIHWNHIFLFFRWNQIFISYKHLFLFSIINWNLIFIPFTLPLLSHLLCFL